MDISLFQYILIFVGVCFAGVIDSIAGGGGLITVPLYLSIGIPSHFILGTNKCVSTLGTTMAVFRYVKDGKIKWKIISYAMICAAIGSLIGAKLSQYLTAQYMTIILLVLVPLIFLFNKKISQLATSEKEELPLKAQYFRSALIGLVVGSYDGIFGPGTGTFLLVAFILFLSMDFRKASTNARIINYTSNVFAFIFFLASGKIYWPVAAVAIFASMLGNWIGSGLVLTSASRVVKPVFQFVLVLLLSKCLYDFFV